MKMEFGKIFTVIFLAVSTAIFTASAQDFTASEEFSFDDDQPGWPMPDEMIENFLNRLRNEDPNTADRLARLREDNPEMFAKEFHKVMREKWSQMQKEQPQRRGRSRIQPQGDEQPQGRRWQKPPTDGEMHGPGSERMAQLRQKHEEYIQWLQVNYPQDANDLEQIRENNPELYMRRLMQSIKRYGRIAETAKTNPQLAEVMKQDIILKDNRDQALKKLPTADETQKEALVKELTQITSDRFDLIIKRKQIQHQQLLERLEGLKEQIKNSEEQVNQWQAAKDEKVQERVKELLTRTEKFEWD